MKFKDWTIDEIIHWLEGLKSSDLVDCHCIPRVSGEITFRNGESKHPVTPLPDKYKSHYQCHYCAFDPIYPDKSFCHKFNMTINNVISCSEWDNNCPCVEYEEIKRNARN